MAPTPKKPKQNRGGGLVSQENMNTTKKKKGGWLEKDDLTVLKCIVRLSERCGDYKRVDRDKMYELILNNIKSNASKATLVDKVRALKTNYRQNITKRGPNGEDPAFSNPHDKALFNLSQKAWGTTTSTARTREGNGIVKGWNARKMETTKAIVAEREDDHRMQEEGKEKEDDDSMQLEKEDKEDDDICSGSDDELVLKGLDQFLTKSPRFCWNFTKDKEQMESLGRKWRKLKFAEAKFRQLKAEFDKEVFAHAQETFKASSLPRPY